MEANNEEEIAGDDEGKKVERTKRKTNRKRARQEAKIDDEKKMLGIIISSLRNKRFRAVLEQRPREKWRE